MQTSLSRIQAAQLGSLYETASEGFMPAGSQGSGLLGGIYEAWKSKYLSGFQQRNALLDGLFYDVGKITEEETNTLAPWLVKEGTLLHVPPTGTQKLQPVKDLTALAKLDKPKALAIAGVGSSALGSAALARNVADAVGGPVVAVVSGFGLADVATEAIGGYFLFGTLNRLRHNAEQLETMATDWMKSTSPVSGPKAASKGLAAFNDVNAAAALLRDPRFDLSVLCGHSKGNLILAEALEKIVRNSPEDAERLQAQSHIITLSAVIKMPDGFKKITDVLGSADPLGYMNSRRSIAIEKLLRGVGHHTNTEFPDIVPRPLDVTATLKDILYTE